MSQYKHYFVQFLGWFDDPRNLYIAMEFVEHGNLQSFIKAPFPEHEAAAIITQVARALQYMHQRNFVHRDVKPLVPVPILQRLPSTDISREHPSFIPASKLAC